MSQACCKLVACGKVVPCKSAFIGARQRVFQGARRPKFHDWCLEKQKNSQKNQNKIINVTGQSQPKHVMWQLSTVAILLYRFLPCWCLGTFFMQYQPCSLLSLYIFFLADQVSCHPMLAALIVCGPLQLFSPSFLYFWDVDLLDPIRCVFKACYWPFG